MPSDIQRLLALPRKTIDPEIASAVSEVLRLHPGAPPLSPDQAAVLAEAAALPAPYAPAAHQGVGAGKTLTALLLFHVWRSKRPLLMVPPGLVESAEEEYYKWKAHYPVVMPHILTYTALSSPTGEAQLRALDPDGIVLDEAHSLSLLTSARTRRFRRVLNGMPNTRVAVVSGTLLDIAPSRYSHLLETSLGALSPAPLDPHLIQSLDNCLTEKGEPGPTDIIQMDRIKAWAGEDNPHRAMHARLASAPGMVVSLASACAVPLHLRLHHMAPPQVIVDASAELKATWQLPNGDLVSNPAAMALHLQNMALGFHYHWAWQPDQAWLEARANWAREVRTICLYRDRPGFDTPALIRDGLERDAWTRTTYHDAWHALCAWKEHEATPEPPTRVAWLDEGVWLGRVVARLTAGTTHPLLWFRSDAVGQRLAALGWDVRGAGDPNPTGEAAAVSIGRFHKGFRMHMYERTAVLEMVLDPKVWQQLLGRLHRRGQTAERVVVDLAQVGWVQRNTLKRATELAKAMQDTVGEPQKLIMATRENL